MNKEETKPAGTYIPDEMKMYEICRDIITRKWWNYPEVHKYMEMEDAIQESMAYFYERNKQGIRYIDYYSSTYDEKHFYNLVKGSVSQTLPFFNRYLFNHKIPLSLDREIYDGTEETFKDRIVDKSIEIDRLIQSNEFMERTPKVKLDIIDITRGVEITYLDLALMVIENRTLTEMAKVLYFKKNHVKCTKKQVQMYIDKLRSILIELELV